MQNVKISPLTKSVEATVSIPGSKSYTNRALLMAAMTKNKVRIHNLLISDDTEAMINCLQELGIKINQTSKYIEVVNDIYSIKEGEYNLNANLSGTTIRFVLALICVVPGVKIIQGETGLNKRPIGELVDGLRQLGAEIEYLGEEGFPPLKVTSSKLSGNIAKIDGSISSQYFSALFMIAPLVGELNIEVVGEQISKPYIDMTIDTMKKFGVEIVNENYEKYSSVKEQQYKIDDYVVEGDVSSASYFAAIAILTQSKITLQNMDPNSVQADMGFFKILKSMGNEINYGENEITVIGKNLEEIEVDMENCPDQVQTMAVLSAFVNGVTKISGVQSLRVKETERVKAIEQELKKMGIKTESTFDTLTIYGGNLKPATIDTYGDHRMAMSFAVAGTKLAGMQINDPDVVTKTFPDFWEKLKSIGVKIEEQIYAKK